MIEKLKTADEAELRDMEKLWPKTKEELNDIIDALTERHHEYGTCVLLKERGPVHKDVRAHWEYLASLGEEDEVLC